MSLLRKHARNAAIQRGLTLTDSQHHMHSQLLLRPRFVVIESSAFLERATSNRRGLWPMSTELALRPWSKGGISARRSWHDVLTGKMLSMLKS